MTALPLVFDAPERALPPRHLADLDPAEPPGRRRRAGPARLPGRPARPPLLRPAHRGPRRDDRPARGRPGGPRRRCCPPLLTAVTEQTCDSGTTRKTLWRLHDGTLVESVLMRYPDRVTVCISSQAGCGMACPFCATGQGGLQRNLSTAEIVDQVRRPPRAARRRGARAARRGCPTSCSWAWASRWPTTSAWSRRCGGSPTPRRTGSGISARGVTVSTVGLVPAIDKLADEGMPVTLAVSLHAPDDELRDTLVPVNNRWKVAEVARRRPALRRPRPAAGSRSSTR